MKFLRPDLALARVRVIYAAIAACASRVYIPAVAMSSKTITIDAEAYERLKGVKREAESFSQTIKRVVRPPFDAQRLIKKVRKLSPATMDGVKRQVNGRSRPSARGR